MKFNSDSNNTDQTNATAKEKIVGRDDNSSNNSYHFHENPQSQIDLWIQKLHYEMENNERICDMVESLQFYQKQIPFDDIVGLENKLSHSGRDSQRIKALLKKEEFTKLLDRWGAYASAQEIIAYLLSRIDTLYETEVQPAINSGATNDEIDKLFRVKVIDPVINEVKSAPFLINYNHVSGMVYWLAELCFVRWHK
ncbi:ABC-three component system protein [Kiloniella laminariae]|uniref:ABC-three component system protein n=1 Tax=Kiloniella laminariae TaxID=454162 RepID=UPI00035F6E78|nr:ABC-three component system protein [Kiloniella laminariae]